MAETTDLGFTGTRVSGTPSVPSTNVPPLTGSMGITPPTPGVTGNDVPSGMDTGRGLAKAYGYPVIEPREPELEPSYRGISVTLDPPPLIDPYVAAEGSKRRMENVANRARNITMSTYRQRMMARTSIDIVAFHGSRDPRLDMRGKAIDISDTHHRLSDGTWIRRFDNYVPGTDNEDRLAREMTFWQKTGRGLGKFVGKTLLYGVGNVVQPFYGLASAITRGKMSALYDNEFTAWLDDIDKTMDYSLAHYYTKEERDMNFLRSMGTWTFWTNDFLSGLSFTAGAMLSGYVFAGTGLMNMSGTFARALGTKAMRGAAEKATKSAFRRYLEKSSVGRFAGGVWDTAAFTATTTGWEASVEARSMMMEAEDNFIASYERFYGRRPTHNELSDFRKANAKAANAVFGANVGILTLSGISTYGRAFNMDLGMDKYIQRRLFGDMTVRNADGTMSAAVEGKVKSFARGFYNVGKRPFMEGIFEEGLQGVASDAADQWVKSRFDPEVLEKNMSFLGAVRKGFEDTYGTAEGWKEIGIGMIIGSLAGTFDRTSGGDRVGFMGLSETKREREAAAASAAAYNERGKLLTDAAIRTMRAFSALNGQTTADKVSPGASGFDITNRSGVYKAFDDAAFGRFKMADELGVLDEESAYFAKIVDSIPTKDIMAGEGIAEADVAEWRKRVKDRFDEKLENYRLARDLAGNLAYGVDNNPFEDYLTNMAYNGMDSLVEARSIADAIDKIYADANGEVAKALDVYSHLSPDSEKALKEVADLRSRIESLENDIVELDRTTRTTPMTDKEGDMAKKRLEKRRMDLEKEILAARSRERKLATVLRQGYRDRIGTLRGSRDDNGYKDMTVDEMLAALSVVRGIEMSISTRGSDVSQRDRTLAELLYDYRSNIVAYRNLDEFIDRMRDPRLIATEERGFARALRNAFSKVYEEDDSVLDFRNTDNPDVADMLRNDASIDAAVREGKLDENEGFMYKTYNHMIARSAFPDFGSVTSSDVVENFSPSIGEEITIGSGSDRRTITTREAMDAPEGTDLWRWRKTRNGDLMGYRTTPDEVRRMVEEGELDDNTITDIAIKIWNGNEDMLSPDERKAYEGSYKGAIDRRVEELGSDPLAAVRRMKDNISSIKTEMSAVKIAEDRIEEVMKDKPKETKETVDKMIKEMTPLVGSDMEDDIATLGEIKAAMDAIDKRLYDRAYEYIVVSRRKVWEDPPYDLADVVNKAGDTGTGIGAPSSSQNPAMLMVRRGPDNTLIVSGKTLAKFKELNDLVSKGGWKRVAGNRNADGTIPYDYVDPSGETRFTVTDGLDFSRWSVPMDDAAALEEATGVRITGSIKGLDTSGWAVVYKTGEDGTAAPYDPANAYGAEEREVIDQEAARNVTDGLGVGKRGATKLRFLMDVNDNYNFNLIDRYNEARKSGDADRIAAAERELMSGLVINIVVEEGQSEDGKDMGGSFVGVMRSLGKDESSKSKATAFRRHVLDWLRGETKDFTDYPKEIEVPGYLGEVTGVRPGKPNLNVTRNEDGTYSVTERDFTAADRPVISNIGVATVVRRKDGTMGFDLRLSMKHKRYGDKGPNLTFMPSASTLSEGYHVPVVVIRHPNGHRYVYPVSMKADMARVEEYLNGNGAELLRLLEGGVYDRNALNPMISELNDIAFRAGVDMGGNLISTGTPNGMLLPLVRRTLAALRGKGVIPNPLAWRSVKDEDGMMETLMRDATINIDLSNPFIGPKFNMRLLAEPNTSEAEFYDTGQVADPSMENDTPTGDNGTGQVNGESKEGETGQEGDKADEKGPGEKNENGVPDAAGNGAVNAATPQPEAQNPCTGKTPKNKRKRKGNGNRENWTQGELFPNG